MTDEKLPRVLWKGLCTRSPMFDRPLAGPHLADGAGATRIYRCVERAPTLGDNEELGSVLIVERWAEDAMGASSWEVVPYGTMRTYVLEEAVLRPRRGTADIPEGEDIPQGSVGYGG